MRMIHWESISQAEQQTLLARPTQQASSAVYKSVQQIIDRIRQQGDAACYDYSQQFDQAKLTSLSVSEAEYEDARQAVSEDKLAAMQAAMENIRAANLAQVPADYRVTPYPGVNIHYRYRAIESVGFYVPGGTAPLVSTVLMLAIPAMIAGCQTRIVCTPAQADGRVNPYLLMAAQLSGVQQVYKLGGAQAVAAMAYGTESVKKVNKIFGPGNHFVTTAKQLVAQDPAGALIDMPAGPSELLIIADKSADPNWLAADLLSQAEHGADSQVILISTDAALLAKTQQAISELKQTLTRKKLIDASLEHARLIQVNSLEQAFHISNQYAPEHLALHLENSQDCMPLVTAAGSVFCGYLVAETLGDYITGSNHVLPTNGYARAVSGLSLRDFYLQLSFQEVMPTAFIELGPHAQKLAELEGLDGHALAIRQRLGNR